MLFMPVNHRGFKMMEKHCKARSRGRGVFFLVVFSQSLLCSLYNSLIFLTAPFIQGLLFALLLLALGQQIHVEPGVKAAIALGYIVALG